jgi:signal transduction histidine kinase
MPITIKTKNRIGYYLAFLLLLISYFLIFFVIHQLAKSADAVSNSYDVINNLESIKAEITDAETGVRGYVITKDVRFLKPYNTGIKKVPQLLHELKGLTASDPSYKTNLDSLNLITEKRLETLASFLVNFQREGFVVTDSMLAGREANRLVMEKIRSMIKDMKENEWLVMEKRNSRLNIFFQSTTIISVISLIIAIVAIVYGLLKFNRESRAREGADKNALSYRQQLENRIDDLKNANAELEELRNIEKFATTGRIARTIAHEVRNPLTNIALASDQLKQVTHDPEGDLLIDMVSRNVVRINHLVSELLNSTKYLHLEFIPVNINHVVDEALDLARDRIELNQVKVEKEYEEMPAIPVDREKMKFAFLNIIVNAVEAMPTVGGILKIRTLRLGKRTIIEFTDNGSGMDAETIERLFEPYYTAKVGGSGLGLTNTQNIVINHKGNISVRSQTGRGSTFTITLNSIGNGKSEIGENIPQL